MLDPVSGSIFGEGEVRVLLTIDAIIQLEENSEACLRKNRVRRLKFNVIVRDCLCSTP